VREQIEPGRRKTAIKPKKRAIPTKKVVSITALHHLIWWPVIAPWIFVVIERNRGNNAGSNVGGSPLPFTTAKCLADCKLRMLQRFGHFCFRPHMALRLPWMLSEFASAVAAPSSDEPSNCAAIVRGYSRFHHLGDGHNTPTSLGDKSRIVVGTLSAVGRLTRKYDGFSSSPLADDGLLQTSTSHDRPRQRLETIMIFGNKSDVKNHLSTKHSLYAHRLFVDDAHDRVTEPLRNEEHSSERSPPPKVEEPEVVHSHS
jgi:hypothetical protein